MIIKMLVLTIISISALMMVAILEADKMNSDEERKFEDEEEIKYLKSYRNGGNKSGF